MGHRSTVIVERELFGIVGNFDSELSLCADWEMWIRLATQTDFVYINEPLIKYRIHAENMSNNAKLLERDTLSTLRKGFSLPKLSSEIKLNKNRAYARNYMVFCWYVFSIR